MFEVKFMGLDLAAFGGLSPQNQANEGCEEFQIGQR